MFVGLDWFAWLHRMHITILYTIMPQGQEREFTDFYIFCGQILTCLPPLLFTVLNELDFDMRLVFISINVFFGMGLIMLCFFGSYDNAVITREMPVHEVDLMSL